LRGAAGKGQDKDSDVTKLGGGPCDDGLGTVIGAKCAPEKQLDVVMRCDATRGNVVAMAFVRLPLEKSVFFSVVTGHVHTRTVVRMTLFFFAPGYQVPVRSARLSSVLYSTDGASGTSSSPWTLSCRELSCILAF
jgi:hypothetical protein